MPLEADLEPDARWTFDDAVAGSFDDMLARSIPQYDVMRATVTDLACAYAGAVDHGRWIVDLGCSRGAALDPIIRARGAYNRYLGVEVSPPMIDAARTRFESWGDLVEIVDLDLRTDYPARPAAVTLAILTLQFVPIEYRQRVVRRAYEQTVPGGALIVVEKILGETAGLDETFVDRYLTMKRDNGYTPDEIDRKRLSLEGVLVPVTSRWNAEMLERAGFDEVDCFWRWLNFAGWIAVRRR